MMRNERQGEDMRGVIKTVQECELTLREHVGMQVQLVLDVPEHVAGHHHSVHELSKVFALGRDFNRKILRWQTA